MARLDVMFKDQGTTIKVVGDLVRGWQSAKNGYGFFGLGFTDFPGDIRVQVFLQVRARPNRLAHLAKTFPETLATSGGSESLHYSLSGPRLEVSADIGKNIAWFEGPKKLGIDWRSEPIADSGPVRFYMWFRVSFNLPVSSNAKVTWEKDLLPFLSGQFESNRRRH